MKCFFNCWTYLIYCLKNRSVVVWKLFVCIYVKHYHCQNVRVYYMFNRNLVWLIWEIITRKVEIKKLSAKIESLESQIEELTHLVARLLKNQSPTTSTGEPQVSSQANEKSSPSNKPTPVSASLDSQSVRQRSTFIRLTCSSGFPTKNHCESKGC